MKNPWFQFYPSDWLNDINLRRASFEEKGFLIDLMCLMHQSPKYGFLTPELEESLAKLLGNDPRTSARLLAKVQQKSLISRDEKTGLLFNKRMVNDEQLRQIRMASGKLGGNPNLVKQKVIHPDNTQNQSQNQSHINTFPKGNEAEPKTFGNIEINKILIAIKGKVEIESFADSGRWERIYGKHCHDLLVKIGSKEFSRRLDIILSDDFKRKNCNRIKYIYEQVKGFMEPKNIQSFN